MATLSFSKTANGYTASITSTGSPIPIQFKRKSEGTLVFKANVGSMEPINYRGQNAILGKDFITSINMPAGVTVTIVSSSEVIKCEYAD